jgi:hypothetical protein
MPSASELRALHDAQLRGHVPEMPPVGSVVQQDGPLVRTHYGTHGSIDYRHLPATGLDTLIARQRDAFAACGERGEWKVYAHDVLAEADGALRAALERAGFQTITTATTYHWAPPLPPAAARPVRSLFRDAEHTALWDRFTAEFDFRPSTVTFPSIVEPPASVTWRLDALDSPAGTAADELESTIERGLRACVPPGEPLYWLDWQHVGRRFDHGRVGNPGQPPWPGGAYPDGDYYLYVTADLRLGTFGHPWEYTVCVFGTELLAQVEGDLTEMLGTPLRHGHSNTGNAVTA